MTIRSGSKRSTGPVATALDQSGSVEALRATAALVAEAIDDCELPAQLPSLTRALRSTLETLHKLERAEAVKPASNAARDVVADLYTQRSKRLRSAG